MLAKTPACVTGAMCAAIFLFLASLARSYYAQKHGSYNNPYCSLGAFIGSIL
jgi:uncharacterized BrkB/YihY/UPF0761 family membrane protein